MMKTLLIGGGLLFAGMTYGGTKAYVDSVAGPGTFNQAVNYGSDNASETFGEGFRVPAKVVHAAKPGFQELRGEFNGVLGSSETPPPARTDLDDSTGAQP